MHFSNELKTALILMISAIAGITILHWFGVFDLLELKTYDYRLRDVRGPLTGWLAEDSIAKTDVVIVEVDDEAWRLVPESWPYSRGEIWGRVVENLSKAGAKVIAFDIQFDTPEPKSEYQKEIWKKIHESDSSFVPPMHGDSVLGEKIADAERRGTRVVLCSKIVREPSLSPPEYIGYPQPVIAQHSSDVGLVDDYLDPDGFLRIYAIGSYMGHEPNKMYLSLGIKALKAFQNLSDSLIPQFDPKTSIWTYGPNQIQALRNSNSFLINYYGPRSNYRLGNNPKWGTFPTYSVAHILDTRDYNLKDPIDDIDWMEEYISSELPQWVHAISDTIQRKEIIKRMGFDVSDPSKSPFYNKIVLIGLSVEVIHDMKQTPFFHFYGRNQYMPGVEVHANAIQSILDHRFVTSFGGRVTSVRDSGGVPLVHILLIILIVVGIYTIESRFTPVAAFLVSLFLILSYVSFALGAFIGSPWAGFRYLISHIPMLPVNPPPVTGNPVWVPVVVPLVAAVLTYFISMVQRVLVESQKKNLLKESFGTYISPELIDEMYQTNHKPELGGVEGHRTAFFTDIVSFSSFSEILTPTQLVTVMNEYLSAMTEIVLRNKGTLDKYIGDAIVAFWGAPLHVENQEILACQTACEMEHALEKLREKWRGEGWPEQICSMHHRIGIHSGPAVTGNMGSTMRMNYTMMGDTVNTAARLESSAKQYGVSVQVSESIVDKALGKFDFMYLDTIRVKGKTVPVKTYQLIPDGTNGQPKLLECRTLFERGVEAYHLRDWETALVCFVQSDNLYEGESVNPAHVYIDRCRHFLTSPPEDSWDGVWTLTAK